MREVKHHKTPFDSQGNQIKIEAGPGGASSAPVEYMVTTFGFATQIIFMTVDNCQGLTNEAMLAIVQDRLECFQEGQHPCAENEGALRHVKLALQELHRRTERRVNQGIEGQLTEKVMDPKRVWIEDGKLRIDAGQIGKNIPVSDLQENWGAWNKVESALRYLDPPVTPEELAVLDGIATTSPARNGLAEVKSALANSAPRRPQSK